MSVIESPDGGASFLTGGGAVGALCRAKSWTETSLGEPHLWPQSLRTVVRIVLSSRYQMWMGWGPDLAFFYNDAYRPTLGVKHEWALGAPAREVWREIWPDIGPRIERVLSSGEATWDEGLLLLLERSGYAEETYHTFSYSPLANDADQVVGMLCVVTEETERIIAARRLACVRDLAAEVPRNNTRAEVLKAAQRQLNQALKDLPFTLLYLFDESGKAVLGMHSGFEGEHLMAPSVIDPADAAAVWPVRELLTSRGMVVVEDLQKRFAQLPRGAWDKAPREVILAPIAQQGQDAPAGFLVAAINPYRRIDDAYLGFIDLVTGQLAGGLANAQAHEEAQRRTNALAELDRAKTTFFSNVSHELRTPLTLMLGPLEDLLQQPDGELPREQRQLLQIAQRNGVRLLKLVNTLLDFSRIEAGRMHATYEPVALSAHTAELASAFRSAVEKAGLRLIVDAPPLAQPVNVDRDMWEKIILNLLSNAFKFTFEGEIRVETRSSPGGDHAQVTISDTGTGIPADELPHLFDRFRRVEGARGRSIEGSGIGLALVQELVKAHGGSIRVTSEVGRGTAVMVCIPFGDAHLPRERLGTSSMSNSSPSRVQPYIDEAMGWLSDSGSDAFSSPLGQTSGQTGMFALDQPRRGQRVLLAEDNGDMRTYLQRLLQTAGFDVVTAVDGEEALAMAPLLRPDLILSDIMMPKVDGLQLLSSLRADLNLRDIPVLLLSARAGEEAKVEGLAAGANDYLTKPFSARELIARVRANLDMAAVRRESQQALRRANESLERLVQERTADLRDKEARLRTIFGTTFTYQAYMAVDGTLLDANPTSLAGINATLEDVVGKKIWEAPWFSATPDMADFVRNAIPSVAAGQTLRREIHVDLGEIGWRWFDFQMRPVLDALGHVVAVVPEAVDVTERRRAEEALRQAQKMEGIGQLTGGVAHDFNNLLTIIMGSLETLRRQFKPAAANESISRALDSAMRGTQRAASLTQRLLAFSRQQPLDPKPADLSRLVSSMSDLLRSTLGEQIAIETVLAGGLWRVNIDANQLEIAIINLAVNARDAMPDGGKLTIESANVRLDEGYVSRQAEVVPGQYVMLAVTDTGGGMSSATAARAFEPFFTTKDVGHGTGLGLSQVYGFVKQSGGHVKIYSELGSGTTVKIYLPRLYAAESSAAAETVPNVARGNAKEIILAVEDDPDVRRQTIGALRELGYQVLEASNGKEALEILAAQPHVDLLFTDVGLPGGMNGRQLSEAALKLRRKLKVLFTTGYARNAIVHDGRLDPGVQLITKPFTFAGLSQKLRDMLDANSSATRILIVEDEDLIQMVIANHVEEIGFEVEIAGSAAEAKNKMLLLNGSIDAAIIDMGLPDARGDDLVSELRAIYPALPVVISSGYDRAAMHLKFASMKNIEFLTKPYTQLELHAALSRLGVAD
jgi:signal transduction histidine kinase/DNA-binding response OmpR family regulator